MGLLLCPQVSSELAHRSWEWPRRESPPPFKGAGPSGLPRPSCCQESGGQKSFPQLFTSLFHLIESSHLLGPPGDFQFLSGHFSCFRRIHTPSPPALAGSSGRWLAGFSKHLRSESELLRLGPDLAPHPRECPPVSACVHLCPPAGNTTHPSRPPNPSLWRVTGNKRVHLLLPLSIW